MYTYSECLTITDSFFENLISIILNYFITSNFRKNHYCTTMGMLAPVRDNTILIKYIHETYICMFAGAIYLALCF